MATTRVTIDVDDDQLTRYADAHLAALWHVAQANPAPHGDPNAGRLAERIGREIIRRWLHAVEPELWHHQGRHYYWAELCRFATFKPGQGEPGSPGWDDGVWVARTDGEHGDPGAGA
jgi:hypothetical protein